MHHLRLFSPSERGSVETHEDGPPVILRFPTPSHGYLRRSMLDPLLRARALYKNRSCPTCRHPVVEPLELDDALRNRNNMPIPGTATLVGFHCQRCQREWPA